MGYWSEGERVKNTMRWLIDDHEYHIAKLWVLFKCTSVNSLAPGECRCNSKSVIFKFISRVNNFSISGETTLRWMPQDLTDDGSTLIQEMAWCHYLRQCWPRSTSPYGVTRPHRVKAVSWMEMAAYSIRYRPLNGNGHEFNKVTTWKFFDKLAGSALNRCPGE